MPPELLPDDSGGPLPSSAPSMEAPIPLLADATRHFASVEALSISTDIPRVPGYETVRELGRGAMGVVYQARHLALGRVVALKMILNGAYAGTDESARFRAEAEAIARLQHP